MDTQNSNELFIGLNNLLFSLNNLDKKFDKYFKRTERQGHGFTYENNIIRTYNLLKSYNYISKFDAYCNNGIPVQIKYIKNKCEICMGDWYRNMNINQDFILHIGFYINGENQLRTIKSYTLFIDYIKYQTLFKKENYDAIKTEFMLISNNKSDDNKFIEFRKKYKSTDDDIVHIRFKRDHKSQRRIQASIPYNKLNLILDIFKPISFDSMIDQNEEQKTENNIKLETLCSILNEMEISQETRKKLEKFYTKDCIVKLCVKNVKITLKTNNVKWDKIHILEPSAGSGVFIDSFDSNSYTAYDIHPESKEYNIQKKDFLKLKDDQIIPSEYKSKDLVVIGNPPYKLAIKFINKCAMLKPKFICFILPNVFKKPTNINKIDRNYHMIKNLALPKKSFELGDTDYDVPSGFFIFIRKDEMRELIDLVKPCIGYKYISFSKLSIKDRVITGAHISIIRVGGRAGLGFDASDINDDALVSKQKYNYFILLDSPELIEYVIGQLNQKTWELDNTTGPRSIGKYELNPILNDIISGYKGQN
jgi:hypothetical protein